MRVDEEFLEDRQIAIGYLASGYNFPLKDMIIEISEI